MTDRKMEVPARAFVKSPSAMAGVDGGVISGGGVASSVLGWRTTVTGNVPFKPRRRMQEGKTASRYVPRRVLLIL